jgi:coenzyme F420 hydrogenase subunit beta
MKTFSHLMEEVQKPGLCHHCGGCVTFCTAINYGALELCEDGRPCYKDEDKCISCGLCYAICPEVGELDEEIKRLTSWTPPIGAVRLCLAARASNPEVRARGTDGGLVTGLLIHMLDRGFIEGAIVSKRISPFHRQPWVAKSKEELLEAAGFHFDTSHGMQHFSEIYSTFSPSVLGLSHIVKGHLNRLALVGTPCQINAVRRMQALGILPADSIKFLFGLFCAGNFYFGSEQRRVLEQIGHFRWEEVRKINVKEELMVHLQNGEVRCLPLDKLDFIKRYACQYCDDYSAEYADLSFGGLGAPEGWTTVIVRTRQGSEILNDATGVNIEPYMYRDDPRWAFKAKAKVTEQSEKKKERAARHHKELEQKPEA